ncbi:glycoside hydrolase family 27 protein [Niveispirillum irakense]|uniref:glycoside hydrolase family 27 protein n=1 Tax=Niveispirillum irakense TaxID=34011 RepID=UPI00041FE3EA|nr:glycoside hydrolase family 27 protein [Niveispirillum irakense]
MIYPLSRLLLLIGLMLAVALPASAQNERGLSPAAQAALARQAPIDNGLARTPPMGWSSWNNFGVEIDEALVIATIDAMIANGMRDAGYIYVNIDDGWQKHKGPRNQYPLDYDPVKFPRGIRYLADYAHERGMKLGLYSGPGQTTCAGYTGSEGHEAEDAALFASWGVDHLKYDGCCSHKDASADTMIGLYGAMSKALIATGRPVVYHPCHCGWARIWEWAGAIGANHWRIGQDISDDYNYPGHREGYYFDVLDMLDRGVGLAAHAKPGQWNDFDMLIVGLDGRSKELVGAGASNVEYRSHFSLWAMLASPLLTGTDIRELDAFTLATLTNRDVIAINQDRLGIQAAKVRDDGDVEIFVKPLADGGQAVAILNRGGEVATVSADLAALLPPGQRLTRVRDLWRQRDLGTEAGRLSLEVIPHDTVLLKINMMEAAR